MDIKNNRGQLIPIVIGIMLFLMIIIPALIFWANNQAKWSMKHTRKTIAFNLAEAGIDRGVWKLKSSTGTWDNASKGIPVSGYNFDTVYTDIPHGTYRIKFSSGPGNREVTIIAEGRDTTTDEVKAIKAVFRNQCIPGAIISKGIITWANAFSAHWGPIMAHNNINITDANAAQDYFPRKFSRQVVTSIPSYPRDTNGIDPPNTDNIEWWSDYPVPDLPVLDFSTMRSSAAVYTTISLPGGGTWVVNTLNVYGCSKMKSYKGPKWWYDYKNKKNLSTCNIGGTNHDGLPHFQNSYRHPLAKKGRIWYWDEGQDVIFTGSTGADGGGIIGDIIVRGNLTNYWGDNLDYNAIGLANCKIPSEAWKEYTKITKTTGDTSAKNQYPGDDGYQKCRATFKFGGETWTGGHNPPAAYNTDVGLVGFLYVGGDFNIQRAMDYYGAIWVVGNVSRATGVAEQSIVFFKDDLSLPALNIVLVRVSWEEIKPSTQAW